MKALRAVHDIDPKLEIMAELKDEIAETEPLGAQVLVAIYLRPEKSVGGIIMSSRTLEEDIYQGKVGLLLKAGPLAFVEDEDHKWGGKAPQVGDWVVYRIGDTFPFLLNKRHCRFIEDVGIKAIVKTPDIVL